MRPPNGRNANIAAVILTLLGCLQMAGHLAGSRVMRGAGAALVLAPFPKVFADVEGLETFASTFTLHWSDNQGDHALAITPELYSRLRGAYNRRNVYGAALSYVVLLLMVAIVLSGIYLLRREKKSLDEMYMAKPQDG